MTVVEVFADIGCPFAHVGINRLVQRRDEANRPDIVLHVRAWPLEWTNGTPLLPALIAEEVDELREQVAPDLFAHFDPAQFPATTLPAFDLVAAAYAVGPQKGERASLALRHALFEQGRPIGDRGVIEAVAAEVGVAMPDEGARALVLADWQDGQARGVIGSPHFFLGADGWFCPSLQIERVKDHLVIHTDPDAFEALVDRILST